MDVNMSGFTSRRSWRPSTVTTDHHVLAPSWIDRCSMGDSLPPTLLPCPYLPYPTLPWHSFSPVDITPRVRRNYVSIGGSAQRASRDRQDAYCGSSRRQHRQQQRFHAPHPGITFRWVCLLARLHLMADGRRTQRFFMFGCLIVWFAFVFVFLPFLRPVVFLSSSSPPCAGPPDDPGTANTLCILDLLPECYIVALVVVVVVSFFVQCELFIVFVFKRFELLIS